MSDRHEAYGRYLERHLDVVREALGIYVERMEYNIREAGTLADRPHLRRTSEEIVKTFQDQRDNGARALGELHDLEDGGE